MPHPYKILNLQGYFSCKTIEKISRLRRENFLNWGEGQLPPQAKSEMTPLIDLNQNFLRNMHTVLSIFASVSHEKWTYKMLT